MMTTTPGSWALSTSRAAGAMMLVLLVVAAGAVHAAGVAAPSQSPTAEMFTSVSFTVFWGRTHDFFDSWVGIGPFGTAGSICLYTSQNFQPTSTTGPVTLISCRLVIPSANSDVYCDSATLSLNASEMAVFNSAYLSGNEAYLGVQAVNTSLSIFGIEFTLTAPRCGSVPLTNYTGISDGSMAYFSPYKAASYGTSGFMSTQAQCQGMNASLTATMADINNNIVASLEPCPKTVLKYRQCCYYSCIFLPIGDAATTSPLYLGQVQDLSCAPSSSPSTSSPTTSSPSRSPLTRLPSTTPTFLGQTYAPSRSPRTSSPSSAPQSQRPSRTPTRSPSLSPTRGSPSRSPSRGPTSIFPTKSPLTRQPSAAPTPPTTLVPSQSPSRTPTFSFSAVKSAYISFYVFTSQYATPALTLTSDDGTLSFTLPTQYLTYYVLSTCIEYQLSLSQAQVKALNALYQTDSYISFTLALAPGNTNPGNHFLMLGLSLTVALPCGTTGSFAFDPQPGNSVDYYKALGWVQTSAQCGQFNALGSCATPGCNVFNYDTLSSSSLTMAPIRAQMLGLTCGPTQTPTFSPSLAPTRPTFSTGKPTRLPTLRPTSRTPTRSPSAGKPTASPSRRPSTAPTYHGQTRLPSRSPSSEAPSRSPTSDTPSQSPISMVPTGSPSNSPVHAPSQAPITSLPSAAPTSSPRSSRPSRSPTASPSSAQPSSAPTLSAPTKSPLTSRPSSSPSRTPSHSPSSSPRSSRPTQSPSSSPTRLPSRSPSVAAPSSAPTTQAPSLSPSTSPTFSPVSVTEILPAIDVSAPRNSLVTVPWRIVNPTTDLLFLTIDSLPPFIVGISNNSIGGNTTTSTSSVAVLGMQFVLASTQALTFYLSMTTDGFSSAQVDTSGDLEATLALSTLQHVIRVNVSAHISTLGVIVFPDTIELIGLADDAAVSALQSVYVYNFLCSANVEFSVQPGCAQIGFAPMPSWFKFAQADEVELSQSVKAGSGVPAAISFAIASGDPSLGSSSSGAPITHAVCFTVTGTTQGVATQFSYAVQINVTILSPCPVGSASSLGNNRDEVCAQCAKGSYSDAPGATTCKQCPKALPYTLAAGATLQDNCTVGPAFLLLGSGNSTSALACPTGANCSEVGLTWDTVPLFSGYWRTSAASTRILTCPTPAYCRGGALRSANGTLYSSNALCSGNQVGPLCYSCPSGFAKTGTQRMCTACNEAQFAHDQAVVAGSVVALLAAFAIVVGIWVSRMLARAHRLSAAAEHAPVGPGANPPSKPIVSRLRRVWIQWVLRMDRALHGLHFLGTKFRVQIALVQVLANLSLSFYQVLAPDFVALSNFLRILSLDLVSVVEFGCVLGQQNLVTSLLMSTLLPLFVVAALLGTSMLLRRLAVFRMGQNHEDLLNSTAGLVIFFLFVIYPSTAVVILEMFTCNELDDGSSSLLFDRSVDCNSAQYKWASAYAGIMVIVYIFGIPALFLGTLLRQRQALLGDKRYRDREDLVIESRLVNEHITATMFLWSPYRPRYFYWESIELLRRLLQGGILIFVLPGTSQQLVFELCITFFFIVLISLVKPYASELNTALALLSQWIIFFVSFTCLLLVLDAEIAAVGGQATYPATLVQGFQIFLVVLGPAASLLAWFVDAAEDRLLAWYNRVLARHPFLSWRRREAESPLAADTLVLPPLASATELLDLFENVSAKVARTRALIAVSTQDMTAAKSASQEMQADVNEMKKHLAQLDADLNELGT